MTTYCLDGIKYAAMCCITLGKTTQFKAFAELLARFIFVENNSHLKFEQIKTCIRRGDHMNAEWYQVCLIFSSHLIPCGVVQRITSSYLFQEEAPGACKILSQISHEIKIRVKYDNQQEILSRFEKTFNEEIVRQFSLVRFQLARF